MDITKRNKNRHQEKEIKEKNTYHLQFCLVLVQTKFYYDKVIKL